ncbi:MAG: hypothetical protein R2722_00665 [Tessaracoccus sp.]
MAQAINTAFARWDHAHLSVFTLADGRVITDDETAAEMVAAPLGTIPDTLEISAAIVTQTVEPDVEFRYVFDLGDNWTHRCIIEAETVDPVEELGVTPQIPLPRWGWGTIPDQYGRRWDGDDGEGTVPAKPSQPHPMLSPGWPHEDQQPPLDMTEVRVAIATDDAHRFLAAVVGREIDDALQQVGSGVPMALEQRRQEAEPIALSVINRLMSRGFPGDQELADDLLAHLRGEKLPGRVLPIDLEALSGVVEGGSEFEAGGYLDLHTGEVIPEFLTDEAMVGEDDVVDIDADPGRWLYLENTGSRPGWQDMAAFAARQADPELRERLEWAIEGRGAFRRFRDLINREGVADEWYVFATDRQHGRARELFASEEIRAEGRPLSWQGS